VEFTAERVAEIAGRPAGELTRRDVALALLRVPSGDALASLPTLRRGLVAAENPMSAPFWDSAEAILKPESSMMYQKMKEKRYIPFISKLRTKNIYIADLITLMNM